MKWASTVLAVASASIASAQTATTSTLPSNYGYGPTHATYQNQSGTILRTDSGAYGPAVEEVHYYYDQWPIGLAVSSTGRIFTCYTRGNLTYTFGVVTNLTAEEPFPQHGPIQNLPTSQVNTSYNGIPFGSADANGLINVQALYITPETSSRPETLWVLDTGRPTIMNAQMVPTMVYAQPGGPKLLAMNISGGNDTFYKTYTFPPNVHFPDSYLNDLRFDLRANVSGTHGEGIAYLVDSSDEGRPGFIMVDLCTGESWRRLSEDPSVLRVNQDVPAYQNIPFYFRQLGHAIGYQREGLDGIQITPDGSRIYYSPLTSDCLYSVPSVNLRARDSDPLADLAAHANISHHGQRGGNGNGFEGDSNGLIYQLMPANNAIFYYDPSDLQTHGFVEDPRIIWPDSASIAQDGYIYMNINQLPYQALWNNGVDTRIKPGAILRVKLPNNGTKIHLP